MKKLSNVVIGGVLVAIGAIAGSMVTYKYYETAIEIPRIIEAAVEDSKGNAINSPTEENIKKAVYWQGVAMRIADKFSKEEINKG